MASHNAPSAPLPFVGRVLGGFRIASPIATGGMATVFLGRKTGPGRYTQTAAIKVIHPHLAQNRELTEMFLDEARLASCVNHPNVCRVLDFGEAEGTFYLAMEYVRGESFAQVLAAFDEHAAARARRTALSAHVIAQACEGLHAIHEAVDAEGRALRIVHRDVSPQNLLVAYDGSIRLLDFGIASAEGRAHTGRTDVVRGRYAYMAPEQMRGLDLDRRADVWSLGVMLREAVTGQNPYLRETQIATMLAVTQELPPSWPSGTEPRLRAIGELALARAPEDRFLSARELGDALTRYLSERRESALSTELSQLMRKLFAEQIAEKRAALRELAGDDTFTDTLSSGYPAARVTSTPAVSTERPPGLRRRAKRKPRLVLAGAAGLLFAASLVGSWYATRRNVETPTPLVSSSDAPLPREADAKGAAAVVGSSANGVPSPRIEPLAPSAVEPALPSADLAAIATPDPGEPSASAESPLPPRKSSAPGARHGEANAQLGSGTVLIGTSQGWASVFDRGKKLGTTPLRAVLRAGSHTLIIRPYGASAARRINVDVRPDETIKLRVDL